MLVLLLTILIVIAVVYGGAWAGMRHRSRRQAMPVGWPLAAADAVELDLSPTQARDLVLATMAGRGAHATLVTTSQVIFTPKLFPAGPLSAMVSVWFTPSVGADATTTELRIEGQDVWQQARGVRRTPEEGPPVARRAVDGLVAALDAATS